MKKSTKISSLTFMGITLAGMSVAMIYQALATPRATHIYPERVAIATPHFLATQTAVQILSEGGNAFDAAVAVGAILGVVQPFGSGLGGGGFWLLHDAKSNQDIFIDARETAPKNIQTDALKNPSKPIATSGIPGEVAAFDYIVHHYGNLSLQKLLAPAISYAKNGFAADARYLFWLHFREKDLLNDPLSRETFFTQDTTPSPKTWITQPQLANTLSIIANEGAAAFYEGSLAKKIVEDVNTLGGNWTLSDLNNYQVKIREPLRESFDNFTLVTVGEPSAGGYSLIKMLHALEKKPEWKHDDLAEQIAYFYPLMLEANQERTRYADPDFHHKAESTHTTYFVIVDKEGNRAAVILTLNDMFGAGVMLPKLGFLLNDEMRDFSIKSDIEDPNNPEPYKRPRSMMSPNFFEDKCRLVILGTPGGPRIANMQFLSLTSAIKELPISDWVSLPRYSVASSPNRLELEKEGFSPELITRLQNAGMHIDILDRQIGDMQAVSYNHCTKEVQAASDPRGVGFSVVF